MKVLRPAAAGTLESSDVFVEVNPCDTIKIEVDSVVADQFGDTIEQAVRDLLTTFEVDGAHLTLKDRGALDCTLRARAETAIRRAAREVG